MSKNQTTHLRSAERNLSNPVALTLRFNEELRQQLADAANRSVRSINSEIIFRLRTSFDHEAVA
jgi:predicted HicB family RNase H-like nuclease